MKFSIVIPTLNEEAALPHLLDRLSRLQGAFEVIVADGGSTDQTISIAESRGVQVVRSERGRGRQLHAGALASSGGILWFVHADSSPGPEALADIGQALVDPRVAAGNFTLIFDGDSRAARHLTVAYPWFRLLGLCYGDSGIFVRRSVYRELGGFQPFPLFEDVDFVRRVKKQGRFVRLRANLTTSSRRFRHRAIVLVFAQWTLLQILYWAGVSPFKLARWYAHIR